MLDINELEIYFPYNDTYIEASVHNYTSKWRFTVAWQHTKIRKTIQASDIPTDKNSLKQMAIACFKEFSGETAC